MSKKTLSLQEFTALHGGGDDSQQLPTKSVAYEQGDDGGDYYSRGSGGYSRRGNSNFDTSSRYDVSWGRSSAREEGGRSPARGGGSSRGGRSYFSQSQRYGDRGDYDDRRGNDRTYYSQRGGDSGYESDEDRRMSRTTSFGDQEFPSLGGGEQNTQKKADSAWPSLGGDSEPKANTGSVWSRNKPIAKIVAKHAQDDKPADDNADAADPVPDSDTSSKTDDPLVDAIDKLNISDEKKQDSRWADVEPVDDNQDGDRPPVNDDDQRGGDDDDGRRRGGYDDDRRRGGYDDRRGGDDGGSRWGRRGGYSDRRGGYDDDRRRRGYDDNGERQDDQHNTLPTNTSPQDEKPLSPPPNDSYGADNDDRRRGGYNDRRGGYNDRRGGYSDRRGGYDRGYDDRRQRSPYQQRERDERDFPPSRAEKSNNWRRKTDSGATTPPKSTFSSFSRRRGGYNDRRGGSSGRYGSRYDNDRRGGFDNDRRGGYNDRRGGYDNDRRGGFDDAPPRRSPAPADTDQ